MITRVALWYIYPIFIVYLSYIYGMFILCCSIEGVRVLRQFSWKILHKIYMSCSLREYYILNCVKTNIISVAPTALFYLWGSFIRGLHPCLCYFVPPGLCFVKFLWTNKNTLHSACFISFLWEFVSLNFHELTRVLLLSACLFRSSGTLFR